MLKNVGEPLGSNGDPLGRDGSLACIGEPLGDDGDPHAGPPGGGEPLGEGDKPKGGPLSDPLDGDDKLGGEERFERGDPLGSDVKAVAPSAALRSK